jgi:hypothetical protein
MEAPPPPPPPKPPYQPQAGLIGIYIYIYSYVYVYIYTRVGARQGGPANTILVRAMDKYTPIVTGSGQIYADSDRQWTNIRR